MTTPKGPSHFPGPWAWDPEDPEDGHPYSLFSKSAPHGNSALCVYFEPGGDPTPEDLANLALIAKAPEMASMLRELLEGSDKRTHSETLEAARLLLEELP